MRNQVIASIAVLSTCVALYAADPPATQPTVLHFPSGDITIGHDTTRITGPQRSDGSIDYVRALNDKLGRGATPDNNAAIVLATLIGPDFAPTSWKSIWETWKLAPPTTSCQWTNFEQYLKDHPQNEETVALNPRYIWQNGWHRDFPFLKQWLTANDKTLNAMQAASQRSIFFIPIVPKTPADDVFDDRTSAIFHARYMCEALCCRALMKLDAKDYAGFESDLHAAWRWSQLFSQTPTLIQRLVGQAMEEIVYSTLSTAVRTYTLPAPTLADLAEFADKIPPTPPLADALDLEERMGILDFVQLCARLGPKRASTLTKPDPDPIATRNANNVDYDRVLKMVNANYDRVIAATRLPSFSERRNAIEQYNADTETTAKSFRDDPAKIAADYGAFVAANLMPNLGKAFTLETVKQQRLDLAVLAIALERYRLNHNEYPKTLETLVPEFRPAIPVDRFNDKPLRYLLKDGGYLLYSVGPNLLDDEGVYGGDKDDLLVTHQK